MGRFSISSLSLSTMDSFSSDISGSSCFSARFIPTDTANNQNVSGILDNMLKWLRDAGMHSTICQDFQVAVAEGLHNAIEHGCRGASDPFVTICSGIDQDIVWAEISDPGDFQPAERPRLPTNPTEERGRGLYLMSALCDTVSHRQSGGGHYLRLEKRFAPCYSCGTREHAL